MVNNKTAALTVGQLPQGVILPNARAITQLLPRNGHHSALHRTRLGQEPATCRHVVRMREREHSGEGVRAHVRVGERGSGGRR